MIDILKEKDFIVTYKIKKFGKIFTGRPTKVKASTFKDAREKFKVTMKPEIGSIVGIRVYDAQKLGDNNEN